MTKTIKQSNKAPRHLRKESAAFFETVLADYVLDDHHLILLTRACESLDRIEEAREIIKKEGLTYRDRFNSSKANPAVATAVFRTPFSPEERCSLQGGQAARGMQPKHLGPLLCHKCGLHTLTDHRTETGIDCSLPKQICSQPFGKEVRKRI